MSGGAVTMMLIGMLVIWGGMGLSIANAVKATKVKKG
ncbi:MetS family NSS transporter small subunit [Alkalihalobacillus deserti]|nr:MetS family NSS transporter small subunit [Alkalihalobacillus deserti]